MSIEWLEQLTTAGEPDFSTIPAAARTACDGMSPVDHS
jgi:hypothetical protein